MRPRELGLRLTCGRNRGCRLSQPAPLNVDTRRALLGTAGGAGGVAGPVEQIQAADARTVAGMSFPAAREFLSATTPLGTYQVKSGFVRGPMPPAGITTMLEWISDDAGRSLPGAGEARPSSMAGAAKVNDLAPDATAFVHRNADFLFKCEALWEPEDDPDLIAANLDWLEGYHAAMQPYLSGGAYQNFPGSQPRRLAARLLRPEPGAAGRGQADVGPGQPISLPAKHPGHPLNWSSRWHWRGRPRCVR